MCRKARGHNKKLVGRTVTRITRILHEGPILGPFVENSGGPRLRNIFLFTAWEVQEGRRRTDSDAETAHVSRQKRSPCSRPRDAGMGRQIRVSQKHIVYLRNTLSAVTSASLIEVRDRSLCIACTGGARRESRARPGIG